MYLVAFIVVINRAILRYHRRTNISYFGMVRDISPSYFHINPLITAIFWESYLPNYVIFWLNIQWVYSYTPLLVKNERSNCELINWSLLIHLFLFLFFIYYDDIYQPSLWAIAQWFVMNVICLLYWECNIQQIVSNR